MTDWAAWSRETVAMMQARNDAWAEKHGPIDTHHWDLDSATMVFRGAQGPVVARIVVGGTLAQGTFLWGWANASLPDDVRRDMAKVRAFGKKNALPLLVDEDIVAGRPEALELWAIAGRILDAEGVYVVEKEGLTIGFLLFDVHHAS